MLSRAIPLLIALLTLLPVAEAQTNGSGLPIPRFVSLASGEVNVRTGPGRRYPIRFVYKRHGTPVEITAEFKYWRRIRDADGDEGWVHKSLLSGRRTALIVTTVQALKNAPEPAAPTILRAEPGVIGRLVECEKASNWCRIEIENMTAWARRDQFFGSYPDEAVND